MNELGDLYQEIILDHYKRPRNAGRLQEPSCSAAGDNPLCGDKISVTVRTAGDRIEDIRWNGAGCAISTASASLMSEAVKGKSKPEFEALFDRFHAMVTGTGGSEGLDKLEVFSGVSEFPVRVKCASLAWHTLKAALEGKNDTVSTE
ncbi:MAG TPA: SUF system NifU family Fe-S cluster assembly protein [Planctomycetota bacterium]|nr:SUF system NifU family Fe-S cluster assembly protein [Planctomycetota bacterium]